MKTPRRIQKNFKLPGHLVAALRNHSERTNITQTRIVELALTEFTRRRVKRRFAN